MGAIIMKDNSVKITAEKENTIMYSIIGTRFTTQNEERTDTQKKLDEVFEQQLQKLCEVYSKKPSWVIATMFFLLKKLKAF